MEKKKICSYCGKRLEGIEYESAGRYSRGEAYCSLECRKRHEDALGKVKRNLKWFAAGILLSVLLMLSSAFMENVGNGKGNPVGGSGMLLLGLTLIFFPYCTPETYAMFGFVNTARLGRGMGILIILFGLWIFFC